MSVGHIGADQFQIKNEFLSKRRFLMSNNYIQARSRFQLVLQLLETTMYVDSAFVQVVAAIFLSLVFNVWQQLE